MKRINIFIIIALTVLSCATTACIEDSFTTSSSDLLTFSTDTLAFDTIFTELGTPTKKFTIHNRHNKMINISSIRVKGESKGKFYLNVDGMKGEEFNNVEIRGNDSIYVFVEAYIDPTSQNNPLEIKDKIQCITNGVEQNVVLTAWGQDVKREHATKITENTTFTAEKPYVIFDTLTVEKDATLTIQPGATLYFHDKAAINVKGKLIAIGSKDAHINLRGDRLDNVVGDISYDIMSGQWGGVNFEGSSFENEMQYVYMRGSSFGVNIDSTSIEKKKLHIFNSILHNSSGSVLTSKYAWIEAEGSEFSDAQNSVVSLTGGIVKMTQCTFANYYLFNAISGAIVNLSYISPTEQKGVNPIMNAEFNNSIIYGNASDINIGDLTGSNVYFHNCLLKSKGSDDDNFISCVWGGNPKFYTVREDYIFDYRLKNESDAIAKGDAALCPQSLRYDFYGQDRFAGNGIDLGAYVWVKAEEKQ